MKDPSKLYDPFERPTAWGAGGAAAGDLIGSRRVVKAVTLAQVVAAGSASGTVAFRVANPSSRLRLMVGVGFVPTSSDQLASVDSQLLTLYPWFLDDSGLEMPGDYIVLSEPLPYAYEGETAADAIRGSLALTSQTSLLGYYRVVAKWEAPDDMPQDRFDALRAACAVALMSAKASITAGASP